MDTYIPYTPDPVWQEYTEHKGYRVYGPGSRPFRYTITYNGSSIDVASTLRGAKRLIRKHKAKADQPRKPKFWERPVIYEET